MVWRRGRRLSQTRRQDNRHHPLYLPQPERSHAVSIHSCVTLYRHFSFFLASVSLAHRLGPILNGQRWMGATIHPTGHSPRLGPARPRRSLTTDYWLGWLGPGRVAVGQRSGPLLKVDLAAQWPSLVPLPPSRLGLPGREGLFWVGLWCCVGLHRFSPFLEHSCACAAAYSRPDE